MRVELKRTWMVIAAAVAAAIVTVPSHALELRDALGQFESGATKPDRCSADGMVGTRREISRFQILPAVWQKYSASREYRDPAVAWTVAEKILGERHAWFQQATGRDWDAIDLYVMWNAPGEYQRARWNRARVSRVVLERAERFANLLAADERLLVRASMP